MTATGSTALRVSEKLKKLAQICIFNYCYDNKLLYTSAIYSFSFCISTGPGPPTKFGVSVLSDIEFDITWEEPINANGIIRTYHIRVYETKTGREVYNRTVKGLSGKGQRINVSNLKPYTDCTFTIQAKTIELGEMANFTAKTLEGGKSELFFCEPF